MCLVYINVNKFISLSISYCYLCFSYPQFYPHFIKNLRITFDKKVIHLSTASTITIKLYKSHTYRFFGVEKNPKKISKHSCKDSIFVCC